MKKVKTILINYGKKHPWFMSMLRNISRTKNVAGYLRYYAANKVDEKVILFESFMGRKYSDSPKAIYEYLIKCDAYKDYTFVWFFRNPEEYRFLEKNGQTKVYQYGTGTYFSYCAKSAYWVTNSSMPDHIVKKKNQKYVQCWHGTPLKRLGYDIAVDGNAMNSVEGIRKKYDLDARRYDYMISPSAFCTEKFTSAFHLDGLGKTDVIVEEGYPRNDFLCNYTTEDVLRIKTVLNLPQEKKVVLYAPTYRDNQHSAEIGYTYKTEVDFDLLREKLGNDYIILFRAHYFVANQFDFEKYKGFIYNVSEYDDINDLYIVSDILITDYSSVFFDYSILQRPIIFYMYDLEEYQNSIRDFYISLDELPGNIVETEAQLIREMEQVKSFCVDERYQRFHEKFTYLDDGQAAKRVAEVIWNR